MILIIPHLVLAFVFAFLLKDNMPVEISDNQYLALGWLVFTVTWPLTFLISKKYFYKLPRLVNLFIYFCKELFMANLRVAFDVVTPTTHMRPCIVALPLSAKTDLEITLLANMISLTPGTLSLGISKDRAYLFVHAITFKTMDPEAIKEELKTGFEARLLRVTR